MYMYPTSHFVVVGVHKSVIEAAFNTGWSTENEMNDVAKECKGFHDHGTYISYMYMHVQVKL